MKLSKAVLNGSVTVKPKPGTHYDLKDNSGCAIGMAVIGAGGSWVPHKPGEPRFERHAALLWWPWTANIARCPCRCRFFPKIGAGLLSAGGMRSLWKAWFGPHEIPVREIITHLFDRHVFEKYDWTLERLTQWIASVEPQQDDYAGRPATKISRRDVARVEAHRRLRILRQLLFDRNRSEEGGWSRERLTQLVNSRQFQDEFHQMIVGKVKEDLALQANRDRIAQRPSASYFGSWT